MKVYGIGEQKTPQPFTAACDKFIYIDLVRGRPEKARRRPPRRAPGGGFQAAGGREKAGPPERPEEGRRSPFPSRRPRRNPREEAACVPQWVVDLIADSLESIADEDGCAFLGKLGNLLLKKQPRTSTPGISASPSSPSW